MSSYRNNQINVKFSFNLLTRVRKIPWPGLWRMDVVPNSNCIQCVRLIVQFIEFGCKFAYETICKIICRYPRRQRRSLRHDPAV